MTISENETPKSPVNNHTPRTTRILISLVAVSCLSMGVAIGAMVQNRNGVTAEDHILRISDASPNPDSLSSMFARVAGEVESSVVHIKVTDSSERGILGRQGTGSGVVVHPAGYILTNQHVIRGATKIRVKLADGTEHDAQIVGEDAETDLAVIRVEARRHLRVARMGNSDNLRVGDWVLAVGSPFGLEQTVTAGIISAKDRVTEGSTTPFQQFLQTDAAINPGNSGGPLVNLNGEVVGINTQIATNTGHYNGIGFALPSSTAVDVYNQLVAHGRVRRGFLGIRLEEVTPQISRLNGLAENEGALVTNLTTEDSPAGRAGIQSGDIIISINDRPVRSVRDLIQTIAALPVGSSAQVKYIRGGKIESVVVKLEERGGADPLSFRQAPIEPRVEEDENDAPRSPSIRPTLGMTVRTLSNDAARQLGLEGARGVIVSGVNRGGLAREHGVREDDIIVEVNNRQIASEDEFNRQTRELKTGDDVVLKILRKDRGLRQLAVFVSFTMP